MLRFTKCFLVRVSIIFTAELDVEDNYLTGDLWPISKMGKIEYFFAYDNMLGGETTKDPYSNGTRSYGDLESSPILQATSLKALDLSTNYYYGTIPARSMLPLGHRSSRFVGLLPLAPPSRPFYSPLISSLSSPSSSIDLWATI